MACRSHARPDGAVGGRAAHRAKHLPPPPAAPHSFLATLWSVCATVLVPLAFLAVPVYPIMQVVALVKLRGPARLLSALPLAFMLPVYAFCLYALSRDSNLWPLYAIFGSPLAFLFTLAVFIRARRHRPA